MFPTIHRKVSFLDFSKTSLATSSLLYRPPNFTLDPLMQESHLTTVVCLDTAVLQYQNMLFFNVNSFADSSRTTTATSSLLYRPPKLTPYPLMQESHLTTVVCLDTAVLQYQNMLFFLVNSLQTRLEQCQRRPRSYTAPPSSLPTPLCKNRTLPLSSA